MNTRILMPSLVVALFASGLLARAQESQITKATAPSLRLNITTENVRQTRTTVEIQAGGIPRKIVKRMEDVLIGSTNVPLSGIADGRYYVYFGSTGYAAQWRGLTVKQERVEPDAISVKLFRRRYVVLRYAFNISGDRALSGKDIKEGRAAVGHWGSLPYFEHDWQVWQKSDGGEMPGGDPYDDMFGDTAFLDFHRFCKGFGFAKVPEGISFDDLKEAPGQAEYRCKSMKAEKGLMLFCRVEGNRKEGLGYGKLVVEEITETPPQGVTLIE